ncbi:tyrosine-type recombinase/integrase [Granulicella arctica]|uniref:tyrosine-type recombinase/integrase n=1 Tax=Granulicella arctica TaxID=940613 RepID=UPI0021DFC8C3|nr:site-specific integrase [Granulicella arctica]
MKHLAPATKAKYRNQLSCIFSHAARWELYRPTNGVNPISLVRQSSKRRSTPDLLTIDEIAVILSLIDPGPFRLMVLVASTTALRRSEVRGLKWMDVDTDRCWLSLKRGVVRMDTTNMKTEASRKGIPIMPQLAEALESWRRETAYNQDDDWVFASPYTDGIRAYWGESVMSHHILPAVKKAGIQKRVGWNTFRRSFASMMGSKGEDVKVVQELMRHASSRMTLDVYQQGAVEAKRLALNHSAGIFMH